MIRSQKFQGVYQSNSVHHLAKFCCRAGGTPQPEAVATGKGESTRDPSAAASAMTGDRMDSRMDTMPWKTMIPCTLSIPTRIHKVCRNLGYLVERNCGSAVRYSGARMRKIN